MTKLPDISDILREQTELGNDLIELEETKQVLKDELEATHDKIVQRYKKAGITQEDCDHPVTKYRGGSIGDECRCCDKVLYGDVKQNL